MTHKALRASENAPGTIRRTPVRLSPSRSKFNVRTDAAGKAARTVDGHLFASRAEAKRYSELRLLQKTSKIRALEVQPRFPLYVEPLNDDERFTDPPVILGVYVADFRYFDKVGNGVVVEDVKGWVTPLAKWKIKHAEAQYGIQVRIVR